MRYRAPIRDLAFWPESVHDWARLEAKSPTMCEDLCRRQLEKQPETKSTRWLTIGIVLTKFGALYDLLANWYSSP
jgi:hypothetical protein